MNAAPADAALLSAQNRNSSLRYGFPRPPTAPGKRRPRRGLHRLAANAATTYHRRRYESSTATEGGTQSE
ncbi:hypothetical protein GCM10022227_09480 [Streptomyces sedi]